MKMGSQLQKSSSQRTYHFSPKWKIERSSATRIVRFKKKNCCGNFWGIFTLASGIFLEMWQKLLILYTERVGTLIPAFENAGLSS
jgi:hypothetical protein